ncbi:MAG: hypothetical protein LBQ66_00205 [Planctomycetaceae bacterium]|jgi:hypothetical protein|nr:hypothetical protein [Planctomycetaceae bacterium]
MTYILYYFVGKFLDSCRFIFCFILLICLVLTLSLCLADDAEEVTTSSDLLPVKLTLTHKNNSDTSAKSTTNDIIVYGDDVTLNLTIKNTMPHAIAYDHRFFQLQSHYKLKYQNDPQNTIMPLIRVCMTVMPNSQNDITILLPNEEQTHEVNLTRIFPWSKPYRGNWNIKGLGRGFGEIGDYVLSYKCEIPTGTKKHLNDAGFQGNFFEGAIQGQAQFTVIPQPISISRRIIFVAAILILLSITTWIILKYKKKQIKKHKNHNPDSSITS